MAKRNGFSIWIHEKGRKLFYEKYQMKFIFSDRSHVDLISPFWNELPQEVRNEYNERSKFETKQDEKKSDFSLIQNNKNYKKQKELARRLNGISKLVQQKVEISLPFFECEVQEMFKTCELYIRNKLKLYDNESLTKRFSTRIKLLSVFPMFDNYVKYRRLLNCPLAEIAVTTFTLNEGVLESSSISILFDDFNVDTSHNHSEIAMSKYKFAKHLGIELTGPIDGLTSDEAWEWIHKVLTGDELILCDALDYNWVIHGLHKLSYENHGLCDFENIFHRIVPVQHFAFNIIDTTTSSTDEIWDLNKISNVYQNEGELIMSARSSQIINCSIHKNLLKNHCCIKNNLRLLNILYMVLEKNELYGFNPNWNENQRFALTKSSDQLIHASVIMEQVEQPKIWSDEKIGEGSSNSPLMHIDAEGLDIDAGEFFPNEDDTNDSFNLTLSDIEQHQDSSEPNNHPSGGGLMNRIRANANLRRDRIPKELLEELKENKYVYPINCQRRLLKIVDADDQQRNSNFKYKPIRINH